MADSFTPNLNLRKPEVGAAFDTWGGAAGLNSDLDILDAVFLATGLGTSVGVHVGTGKVLNIDDTGELKVNADGITIFDRTDPTKAAKLVASSITTATTRSYTLPDANGTVALIDDVSKRSPRGTVLYGLYGATAPEGTLWLNGTTFGNAASGASQRANADTWLIYDHFWTKLGATPTGGRGATALADFNAGKPMPLPNFAGRAPFALDNNGGIASANVLAPGAGANSTVRGAVVGQSTEAAGVNVSGTIFVGGSATGSLGVSGSTGGSVSGQSQTSNGSGSVFDYTTHAHSHNISGTASGTLTVSANGGNSMSGATVAVTNVPPGAMCDCVIVM
jgi:hypothetical protein